MHILRKWARLSWRDRLLVIEAVTLQGLVRLMTLSLPFRWLTPILGQQHDASEVPLPDGPVSEKARRCARQVRITAAHLPWESKCLVQALACKLMLRRRGIKSVLYLGVARDEEGTFVSHAWLRHGEVVLTGRQGMERYKVISTFC